MKTHHYYVHRGLALGLAKYVATGRDLPTKRVDFVNTFTRYGISHLGPALDTAVMLLITLRYSAMGQEWYNKSCLSLWIATFSWFLGPAIYNPFGFSYKEGRLDIERWSQWMRSGAFDDWFYGQKASASTGDLNHNNWFSWLNAEPTLAKTFMSVLNLFLYGTMSFSIGLRLQLITTTEQKHYLILHHEGLQWFIIFCFLAFLLFAARVKRTVIRSIFVFVV